MNSTTNNDNAPQAAIHEAGHAVAAILMSLRPQLVSIEDTEKSIGHAVGAKLDDELDRNEPLRDAGRRRVEELTMVLLAGPAAEALSGFEPSADEDSERALLVAESISADAEEATAYVAWLRARVRNLLRGSWKAVTALAQALALLGELPGKQARKLVDAHGHDQPPSPDAARRRRVGGAEPSPAGEKDARSDDDSEDS